MYIVAASFVACFSVAICNDLLGPESPGISAEYRSGAMVLTEVQAESPAERTGLRIGDRIVSVDGQSVRNVVDWMGIRTNFEVGALHQLEIERGSGRLRLTLTLWRRQPFKNW